MKSERQSAILEIIAREDIDTQELLQTRLRERGIACTQATISRDMKCLHLVKEPAGRGQYRYVSSERRDSPDTEDRLRSIFRQSVTSVDFAGNMVVMKTMPGLANGASAAIDSMNIPSIVGSLAGDDTAFLVMRDRDCARKICEEFLSILN